jgi:hypothetical protein
MENITVGELVQKVQELDMFFFEAGVERESYIKFNYKLNKEYRANLTICAPCDDEDYDND